MIVFEDAVSETDAKLGGVLRKEIREWGALWKDQGFMYTGLKLPKKNLYLVTCMQTPSRYGRVLEQSQDCRLHRMDVFFK